MPRTLGVDYGQKRIGFAVSDPGGIISTPLCVETCAGDKDALRAVQKICAETGAEKIVMGLPRNMDGSYGPQAEKVRAFVEALQTRLDVEVTTWDERLSTVSAERVLIDAGTSRKGRKKVIDKLAAQIMLQNYLDAESFRAGDDME